MHTADLEQLFECLERLAEEMRCRPLDREHAAAIVDQVLFPEDAAARRELLDYVGGRSMTESKLCRALVDIARRALLDSNDESPAGGPSSDISPALRERFELALFGRPAELSKEDLIDGIFYDIATGLMGSPVPYDFSEIGDDLDAVLDGRHPADVMRSSEAVSEVRMALFTHICEKLARRRDS